MAYYFLISMHIVEIMRFAYNICKKCNVTITILLPGKRHVLFLPLKQEKTNFSRQLSSFYAARRFCHIRT